MSYVVRWKNVWGGSMFLLSLYKYVGKKRTNKSKKSSFCFCCNASSCSILVEWTSLWSDVLVSLCVFIITVYHRHPCYLLDLLKGQALFMLPPISSSLPLWAFFPSTAVLRSAHPCSDVRLEREAPFFTLIWLGSLCNVDFYITLAWKYVRRTMGNAMQSIY